MMKKPGALSFWLGAGAGRRAAGYPCDECRRIIALEYEAQLCALCVRPLHARRAKAHDERYHPKGDGPYR